MLDAILRQLLPLLEPVGFLWLALIVIAALLFWRRRRALAGAVFAAALVLTIVGSTGLPGAMLASLERPFAGRKIADILPCDAVVMLGGGLEPSRYEVGGVHFTKAGDRIIMALELMRLGKAPVLVLGGAASEMDGSLHVEADLTRDLLASWKLPGGAGQKVISLGENGNTHDEALKVHELASTNGWRRIALVTSAFHMARASAVFKTTTGLEVIPAPCNFLTEVSTAPSAPGWHIPTWNGFEKISVWMHEQIGWAIYRRRGWIDDR